MYNIAHLDFRFSMYNIAHLAFPFSLYNIAHLAFPFNLYNIAHLAFPFNLYNIAHLDFPFSMYNTAHLAFPFSMYNIHKNWKLKFNFLMLLHFLDMSFLFLVLYMAWCLTLHHYSVNWYKLWVVNTLNLIQ